MAPMRASAAAQISWQSYGRSSRNWRELIYVCGVFFLFVFLGNLSSFHSLEDNTTAASQARRRPVHHCRRLFTSAFIQNASSYLQRNHASSTPCRKEYSRHQGFVVHKYVNWLGSEAKLETRQAVLGLNWILFQVDMTAAEPLPAFLPGEWSTQVVPRCKKKKVLLH